MNLAQTERVALKETLLEKGPDAPTLCGDWTTKELAAHLYVREQKPGAALRSLLPGKQDPAKAQFDEALDRPYEEIVQAWAAGPQGLNPWRVLDSLGNSMEHFIHHEDVLRGALNSADEVEVRPLDHEHGKELHRLLKLLAPRMIKSPRPVVLVPKGFPRIVLHEGRGVSADGENVCRISGGVGELLLWLSGRDIVKLTFEGNQDGVVRGSL
ncbi:hypothetical protein N24_2040 [Corynebacterium suranareeae]|uniref:Mycothiol-dependent maleylpyruvate isomerase metal-binding domain-containing protein n=1 Tax=Corynebacterium suranareeae TaxID=2506452 RepID=A0A169RZH9_9CORY|nr:TIGR03085 family metal-binding protein [Corynebacterium suranareeae]BAU96302.1 hypothetical protein N24_2040 [Corynebacterium suranareeae]